MKDESTKKSGAAAVEVPTITRDELRDLMEKDKGVVVVDVLSPESYAQKHIRGAINIPLADMETRLDQLPKKGKVVLYCANFKCKASTAATETLQKHGYDAVDYEGGIADWIEGGLPVN